MSKVYTYRHENRTHDVCVFLNELIIIMVKPLQSERPKQKGDKLSVSMVCFRYSIVYFRFLRVYTIYLLQNISVNGLFLLLDSIYFRIRFLRVYDILFDIDLSLIKITNVHISSPLSSIEVHLCCY